MTTDQRIFPESAELWRKRWNSFRVMWDQTDMRWDRLDEYIGDHNLPSTVRRDLSVDTLRGMLDRLREFGQQHFAFFYHGFVGSPDYAFAPFEKDAKLEPSLEWIRSEYSIGEFILATIFERLTFDLQVLDQAIDQRIMAAATVDWSAEKWEKKGIDEVLNIYNTTNTADDFALQCLLLFSNSFALDRVAAITYYRDAATMRVIPYAEVALIGLPISSLSTTNDMLAIPHEIGHFLYWNGKNPAENSSQPFHAWIKLQLEKDGDHPWLEEIVADIVSCLIGGQITTLSIQRLMETAVGKMFLYDDGKHPLPAIRPLIYLQVLEKKLLGDTQNLRNMWDEVLKKRTTQLDEQERDKFEKLIIFKEKTSEPDQEKHHYLTDTLYTLVDTLANLINIDTGQSVILPTRRLAQAEPVAEYAQLVENFIHNEEYERTSLRIDPSNKEENQTYLNPLLLPSDSTVLWKDQISQLFGQSVPDWLTNIKQPQDVKPPIGINTPAPPDGGENVTIPATDWLTVFDAGGWTSGGGGPTNFKDIRPLA